MNRGWENYHGFIVTRCDSSILLQPGKEVLDQVPSLVLSNDRLRIS
jgi:hypothetical protein